MTYYERSLRRYYWIVRLMVYSSLVDIGLFGRWTMLETIPLWLGVLGVVFFTGMLLVSLAWSERLERTIAAVNVATLPSTYVMRVLRKEVICPDKSRSI